MRVAFLDQYSEMGGAQWCLADVMRGAAQRGWDGELWVPGNGPLRDVARELGWATHSIPLRRYRNGSKSLRDLAQYPKDVWRSRRALLEKYADRSAANQSLDLIYVNAPRALPCVIGSRAPVLFHSHSVLDKAYSRWVAKWSLRSCGPAVLASSEFLATRLRPVLGDGRVRVIYNGVPDYGYRERDPAGALRVGIVGRIAPEKGHLDFLDAARQLASLSDVKFVIVGAEMFSSGEYQARVREQGEELGIEFAGWRAPAEIYNDLDILVTPSASHDANPRVLMEAMAAGVCVVAYRSGGISEIVIDGEDGLLTGSNPMALAGAIRTLAGDPNFRRRLSANGRKTYEQRFSVHRFRHEVCGVIENFVAGAKFVPTVSRCEPAARAHEGGTRPVSR